MYVSKLRTRSAGYSPEKYDDLLGKYNPYILKGNGLTPSRFFDKEQQKSTQEIVGQYADVYFQGAGVQRIKFPKNFNFDAIKDMSAIELIEPQACEVNGQIYVKAEGLKQSNG